MEQMTPTPPQPTNFSAPRLAPLSSRKKFIVIVCVIVVAALLAGMGGYAWWKHSQPPRTISGQRLITLQIDHDKISGNNILELKRNEPVAFVINGDNNEERDFVIPAYGISTTFSHHSVGNAEFVTGKAGSFPMYLHDEDGKATQIGKVVVQ